MGGGPKSQINTWNFVRKTSHFFKKKPKYPKQPKKQNKPNFHFSLSVVPNVRGGWVGSDVWNKVPKKTFFFLTPSLIYLVVQCFISRSCWCVVIVTLLWKPGEDLQWKCSQLFRSRIYVFPNHDLNPTRNLLPDPTLKEKKPFVGHWLYWRKKAKITVIALATHWLPQRFNGLQSSSFALLSIKISVTDVYLLLCKAGAKIMV